MPIESLLAEEDELLVTHRYTLFGVIAILLWGCLVGLTRNVAEQLGAIGGAAAIYTCASLFLMLVMGVPKLREFSPRYVLIGGGLFAAYEVCFSLALGFANDRQQTLEMAIVNYLWPSLTVLLAVLMNRERKISLWIYPALAVAFSGVMWSILGDEELSLSHLQTNIASNPVAYTLAFVGAFIWAVYCNITQRYSKGKNGISLFFIFTAIALWIQYVVTDTPTMHFDTEAILYVILASVFMGSGYALWNIAIIKGNMLLLATLSYFTPIISTFFSMLIFGVTLTSTFWQGVIMVTLGSIICWWVTRTRSNK